MYKSLDELSPNGLLNQDLLKDKYFEAMRHILTTRPTIVDNILYQ
jgi:hypothetical protein